MLIEIFSKKFIKEYFNRNKILILLSATIFIVSILIGAIFHNTFQAFATEIIKKMIEEIPLNSVSESAIGLFMNNVKANLIIIFGGLFFSILSTFSMIVNGILIGYVFTLTNPLVFFVGIAPHGIFELTGIVLSLTGAFIITKMEIRIIQALFRRNLRNELENVKISVMDLIFTIIVSIILIIIAAIIEAAITPILLNMVI